MTNISLDNIFKIIVIITAPIAYTFAFLAVFPLSEPVNNTYTWYAMLLGIPSMIYMIREIGILEDKEEIKK